MAIKMSRGLKNAVLFSHPLTTALSQGVIHIYSGPQPGSANDAPTGTLLGSITRDGLSWSEGNPQGGLMMSANPSSSLLYKGPTQLWQLTVDQTGTAGWFRFRSNGDAAVNLDGEITAPYQELYIGSPQLTTGETREIEIFQIGFYW